MSRGILCPWYVTRYLSCLQVTRYYMLNAFPQHNRSNTTTTLVKKVGPSNVTVRFLCSLESDSDETDDEQGFQGLKFEYSPDYSLQCLHPESDDPLICALNNSASVQNVFDLIKQNEEIMNSDHVSQAVLVLWTLQKIMLKIGRETNKHPYLYKALTSSLLKQHEQFIKLLQLVEKYCDQMSPNVAAHTLYFLKKLDVNLSHTSMQKLVAHCTALIESMGYNFPFIALTKYTSAVCLPHNLYTIFVLQDSMPFIFNVLETCDSIEDLNLLTTCLRNIRKVLISRHIDIYYEKVEFLLNKLGDSNPKIILKILNFLIYHDSSQNINLIRKLLLLLQGNISKMETSDICKLNQMLVLIHEPAQIIWEVHDTANKLLSEVVRKEISSPLELKSYFNTLYCAVIMSPKSQRRTFEKLAHEEIRSSFFFSSPPIIFKFIRKLNTSDVGLCDIFWNKTVEDIETIDYLRSTKQLLSVCNRYMNFNSNLSGTYRHYNFERRVIEWLLVSIEKEHVRYIPHDYAIIMSFILAYGNILEGDIIDISLFTKLVQNLEDLQEQFSSLDVFALSRGFYIAMNICSTKISDKFLKQYSKVNSVLNKSIQRNLFENIDNLSETNNLVRAYRNLKGDVHTTIFHHLLVRYTNWHGSMSSNLLRETTRTLHDSKCFIPEIVDQMVQYVVENRNNILAETCMRLLHLCYLNGFTPRNRSGFLDAFIYLLQRDKDSMGSLDILIAALSLCYFNRLPQYLINHIFTVDFLEGIENEISNCYSKAIYPFRIRHTLMEVNRAVCLDYPDADIPWFHKKYCQEIIASETKRPSKIHNEVHEFLSKILGQEFVTRDAYSPYFYKIDFLVLLNAKKMPVTIKHEADTGVTKLAILLLKDSQHSGPFQLKRRHLEMMGYKIVTVDRTDWLSMFMAEPKAKVSFLEEKLFGNVEQVENINK